MGRSDQFRASNPAERYYDWRSDQKAFCWWDKDNEERVPEAIGFKFLILRQSIRITGVDDQTKQQILSNEVKGVGKEPMRVRLKDGTVLAEGLWKDIKDVVKTFGGHYTKIVFAMDENGSLICLRVRTKGLLSWGETIDKSQKKQKEEWIVVDGFKEDVYNENEPYTYPTFSFGGKPHQELLTKADELYDELIAYYDQLSSAPAAEPVPPAAKQSTVAMPSTNAPVIPFAASGDDDDLPF
jgi:hypothetical protein